MTCIDAAIIKALVEHIASGGESSSSAVSKTPYDTSSLTPVEGEWSENDEGDWSPPISVVRELNAGDGLILKRKNGKFVYAIVGSAQYDGNKSIIIVGYEDETGYKQLQFQAFGDNTIFSFTSDSISTTDFEKPDGQTTGFFKRGNMYHTNYEYRVSLNFLMNELDKVRILHDGLISDLTYRVNELESANA